MQYLGFRIGKELVVTDAIQSIRQGIFRGVSLMHYGQESGLFFLDFYRFNDLAWPRRRPGAPSSGFLQGPMR